MTFFLSPSYPPHRHYAINNNNNKNVFKFPFHQKMRGNNEGNSIFPSLNSFLNTPNTIHLQGVSANQCHMISRKCLTHKQIRDQSYFGVLCIIWKGAGGRVAAVKKYNPAKQNVKSFKSTMSLTFSGLGTKDTKMLLEVPVWPY